VWGGSLPTVVQIRNQEILLELEPGSIERKRKAEAGPLELRGLKKYTDQGSAGNHSSG